jgi:Yip1 domain
MATLTPELPMQHESFADDLAGIPSFFIDPPGAAKRVHTKWFWVGALIVSAVVTVVIGVMSAPILQHVLEIAPIPQGRTPEQYQKGIEIGLMIQKILTYCSAILGAAFFAIMAATLLGMSSIMGVKAKFLELFNLVAGCNLIQVLAGIATLIIIKAKGEISTMAELQPPLGLDIFLPETANKMLLAFLGYFSIFNIWWCVMMILVFSAAFKVSKGKAFAAVAPLILIGLLWKIGTAAMQPR